MQTVDQGKLFQSDAQLSLAHARLKKSLADQQPTLENGHPVILPSKPLQILIDKDDAYVAENGFVAQRINLKTGKVKATFRGHTGPVTSLALTTHTLAPLQNHKLLFTGSWDRTIKVWDVETQVLLSTSNAHVDFVKSLHLIPALRILVSGSTDRDVRLWSFDALFESLNWSEIDLTYRARWKVRMEENQTKSVAEIAEHEAIPDAPIGIPNLNGPSFDQAKWPGALYGPMTCIGILKSHTRPIDIIKSYPTVGLTEQETFSKAKDGTLLHLLVSADSMGALKVWLLDPSNSPKQKIGSVLDSTTWPHKTSINDIQIGCEVRHDVDHQTSAQLWTASADNTVLCSTLDLLPLSNHRVVRVLRIEQPYFIRCVLNLPLLFAETEPESHHPNWLITGSTDEDIRIYDLENLEEKAKSNHQPLRKLGPASADPDGLPNSWFASLKAHWHEVNCLGIWSNSETQEKWLVSSGLDGTLRKWRLKELQQRFDLQSKKKELTQPHKNLKSVKTKTQQFELTPEEEAELAEMMDGMS